VRGALSNGCPYRVPHCCAFRLLHLLTTGYGTPLPFAAPQRNGSYWG